MKKIGLLLFIILFLQGCGGGKETLNLSVTSLENSNNSNAVVIKIYQLKNAEKFRHASLESLIRNPEEVLSEDLITGSKYEKTLIPNEQIDIKDLEIQEGTAFLGIVGDFFSPAKDGWQQVITIDPDIENIKIVIHENFLSYETEE